MNLDLRIRVHEQGVGGHGDVPAHIRKVVGVLVHGAGKEREQALADLGALVASGSAEIVSAKKANPSARGRALVTESDVKGWIKRHADGESVRKIANSTPFAYATIHKHLKQAGVEFRPYGVRKKQS